MASERDSVTTTVSQVPDQECDHFAFVMNIDQLIGIESYELAPNNILRRAITDEVSAIKNTLCQVSAGFLHPMTPHLWEQSSIWNKGRRLEESEWRYFVISFKGCNNTDTFEYLRSAANLAPQELEIGLTFLSSPVSSPPDYCISWHSEKFFQAMEDAHHNQDFFLRITKADLDIIAAICNMLTAHNHHLIDLMKPVRHFCDLRALPRKSPLRFLGYFAILESLLTHLPKPSDPYDSITRQVKKKIALLDHRFGIPINYHDFGGASTDTIWTKMYAYRSRLAHGGAPTLTGDLAVLRSHYHALCLLKETVKSVIRQSLVEPQLLLDLREC